MIKYVNGDLFENIPETPTIIAHVCNDKGAFGAGFVVPLAQHFPATRNDYIKWSKIQDGSFRRGQVQFVVVRRGEKDVPQLTVANMVAQTLGGQRPLFYNDLARCMGVVRVFAEGYKCGIICPMFGAGLAGGDWNFVEKLIEDCWVRRGIEVTVCYLPQFLPDNWSPPADTPQ